VTSSWFFLSTLNNSIWNEEKFSQ